MQAAFLDSKEGATTIRPPAFAELLVDSLDRYGTMNPKDAANAPLRTLRREIENKTASVSFNYQKASAQLQGYFTRLAISDLEIDWRTPNLNERNNSFRINVFNVNSISTVRSVARIIDISEGFYNGQQLASSIQGQFVGSSFASSISTIGVTGMSTFWNPSTAQLTIQSLGTSTCFAINNERPFDKPNVGGIGVFLPPPEAKDLRFTQLIGAQGSMITTSTFVGANISTIGNSNSYTGQPTNLAYTNYIDIVSDQLTKYARVKDNMTRLDNPQQSVVARVYMNAYNTNNDMNDSQATTPHTFSVDYSAPKYIRWNPAEYLNNFDLTLYDEYGDRLFWTPLWSTEYRFTLQATES